jgi:methionyl aminopeptidase
MEVTEQSLYEGLKMAKAGNHLTDISHAIGEYVHAHGFSIPSEYTGHGIGSEVHEDPIVPNYGKPHKGVRLKEGMCLAVEPMVHFGKPQTRVLDDEWTVVTKDGSLAAHFEHSIVITKDGCKILTTRHDKEES